MRNTDRVQSQPQYFINPDRLPNITKLMKKTGTSNLSSRTRMKNLALLNLKTNTNFQDYQSNYFAFIFQKENQHEIMYPIMSHQVLEYLNTHGYFNIFQQFQIQKVLKEMNDEKILEQYQKSINNSTILNDNEGKLREKQQKSIIQDKKEKKETSVQQNQIIQKEDKQEQQLVKPDQQDSQIQEEEKDKIQEEEKDKIVNEGNIEKQDKSIDDQNQTVNQEIVKNE